eukprot:ANDGO_08620.mRNA.1 hypothetical protein
MNIHESVLWSTLQLMRLPKTAGNDNDNDSDDDALKSRIERLLDRGPWNNSTLSAWLNDDQCSESDDRKHLNTRTPARAIANVCDSLSECLARLRVRGYAKEMYAEIQQVQAPPSKLRVFLRTLTCCHLPRMWSKMGHVPRYCCFFVASLAGVLLTVHAYDRAMRFVAVVVQIKRRSIAPFGSYSDALQVLAIAPHVDHPNDGRVLTPTDADRGRDAYVLKNDVLASRDVAAFKEHASRESLVQSDLHTAERIMRNLMLQSGGRSLEHPVFEKADGLPRHAYVTTLTKPAL